MIHHPVNPSQFADDLGLWVVSRCQKLAEYDMQKALNSILVWSNKWRMKMESNKTKAMFLDASSHIYKRLCLSVRPSVRPLVRPSVHPLVCPSVGPLVRWSVTHSLKHKKFNDFRKNHFVTGN